MDVGSLLRQYKEVIEKMEEINLQKTQLHGERLEIEGRLRSAFETAGIDSFSDKEIGMSVTVKKDMRAKYDPEHWDEIVRWAGATGNIDCIHRRLSDSKIKALLEEGVRFPRGLTLESYEKISYRRS